MFQNPCGKLLKKCKKETVLSELTIIGWTPHVLFVLFSQSGQYKRPKVGALESYTLFTLINSQRWSLEILPAPPTNI